MVKEFDLDSSVVSCPERPDPVLAMWTCDGVILFSWTEGKVVLGRCSTNDASAGLRAAREGWSGAGLGET